VNEWGEKELKFLELKNGSFIPMSVEKSNKLLKTQDTQGTNWWVIVGIVTGVAIVIFVALLVIAALIFTHGG
jgi:hypothetical protein